MINGSIIFAVQTLGTVLMKKKEVNEFYHEEDYPNEVSLKTDNLACPDVNPRDLIHYRGFYILWLLQLIECFPAMTFLSVYKSIGFAAIKERLFVRIVGESSAAFLLVGFILWSFLADKVSYKTPLLSVALCWTIGLAIFPQCLKLQLIKFFYAMLVFVSVLCIAGYRILVFVTVAKAFGVKYLNYNFACVNTASIFGGVSYTLFAIYFPILEKIDAVLYICAALNALALLLLVFLPDTKHVCTCFKSVTHVKDEEA
uniref:Oxalate:formate antiporter n=1 Tax=Echinococcus granulosus TaxID=6210 RepID=A0A068WC58_ECHGR|nr:oxalate:formate antiporter [Echinococcus granulosus]